MTPILDDDTVADALDHGRLVTERAAVLLDGYIGTHGDPTPDAAGRAQAFILCRCLADVRAAALLSTSCYPSQIASVLRSTHESLCIVRMLHHEPEEAENWWAGKRYRVADVRKRAKLEEQHPFDDVYSYLCGLSHARSEGIDTQYTLTGPTAGKVSTGPLFYSNPRVLDSGYHLVSTLVEVSAGYLDHFPTSKSAPAITATIAEVRATVRPSILRYAEAFTQREPEHRKEFDAIRMLVRNW